MSRIFLCNRFFFPDHSANSQLLTDLAFDLAAAGKEVHVIASRQLYDNPSARLPGEERVAGVCIHRLATTRFGRSSLLGRTVDYVSFYCSIWTFLHRFVARGDILVIKTDPPLVSVLAMWSVRRRDVRIVNWLQDLYPEVAIALGVPVIRGRFGKMLLRLRDRSLEVAMVNVVVGHGMRQRLLTRGVEPGHVLVISNWTDDDKIAPLDPTWNPLRCEWGLEDRFVIGYSGNLGRAHEFETLLAAAERLRHIRGITFLFIGGGHQIPELAAAVSARGLNEVFRFIPYQKREILKCSLAVPDVHWVSLRPQMEGLMMPSKFLGAAAAGRPIIAITARHGELAELLRTHDCGVAIEPGNVEALVKTISVFAGDRKLCRAMGQRARQMLDTHFSRQQGLRCWREVLNRSSGGTDGAGHH